MAPSSSVTEMCGGIAAKGYRVLSGRDPLIAHLIFVNSGSRVVHWTYELVIYENLKELKRIGVPNAVGAEPLPTPYWHDHVGFDHVPVDSGSTVIKSVRVKATTLIRLGARRATLAAVAVARVEPSGVPASVLTCIIKLG